MAERKQEVTDDLKIEIALNREQIKQDMVIPGLIDKGVDEILDMLRPQILKKIERIKADLK